MRLVFVHGSFATDGAWWWRPMNGPLTTYDVHSTAVVLSSCEADPRGDLHDDAAAVRAVLDESDEPAMVCGHSYGGMVATEDESISSFGGSEPAPFLVPHDDGTVGVRNRRTAGGASPVRHSASAARPRDRRGRPGDSRLG